MAIRKAVGSPALLDTGPRVAHNCLTVLNTVSVETVYNRVQASTSLALPPWPKASLRHRHSPLDSGAQCAAPFRTPWPGRQWDACATRALPRSSFLLLWSAVLIMYPTSLAVISMTFSNYVLQPVFPNCIPPATASRVLSMACLSKCPPWGQAGPLLPALCGRAEGQNCCQRQRGRPQDGVSCRLAAAAGDAVLLPLRLDVPVAHCEGHGLGRPPTFPPVLPSAPDVGEQLQCALGHTHTRHLHRREAAGPVTHHWHGLCPDLPR